MAAKCPKCQAPIGPVVGECRACGFVRLNNCPVCGKGNFHLAQYCGGCGAGLTFGATFRKNFRQIFTDETRARLKNVAAGLAFGGVLSFFAFGNLGMMSTRNSHSQPEVFTSQVPRTALTVPGKNALSRFEAFLEGEDFDRDAEARDIVNFGTIVAESFGPYLPDSLGFGNSGTGDIPAMVQSLNPCRAAPDDSRISRADLALFLFRIANDIFGVMPPTHPTFSFRDVPRYHFLNIPIETLESLGLKISRDPQCFGPDDRLSLALTADISRRYIQLLEGRLKNRLFKSLSPKGSS